MPVNTIDEPTKNWILKQIDGHIDAIAKFRAERVRLNPRKRRARIAKLDRWIKGNREVACTKIAILKHAGVYWYRETVYTADDLARIAGRNIDEITSFDMQMESFLFNSEAQVTIPLSRHGAAVLLVCPMCNKAALSLRLIDSLTELAMYCEKCRGNYEQ
jgi:hypothetical protein